MNNEIKDLVVKYIVGQADHDEIAAVKQWISMSKDNEDYYAELYEAWHDSLHAEPHLIDAQQAYRSFLRKTSGQKTVYKQLLRWSKIAAVLILICSVGAYFYSRQYGKPERWHTIHVSNGAPRKLILPDGTIIWINSGSHVRYNANFGRVSRTLYLDGEAYFDIAKNKKDIPFLVKTQHFTIRDIGTVFNIKAYSNDPSFEATVIEGKIAIEGKISKHDDENSRVFLEKKQVLKITSQPDKDSDYAAEYNHAANNPERVKVLAIDESQLPLYNGWKDDFLVFEETSFKELAKIIERRYDVEIVFQDEDLLNFKYTGSFRNVESISKVMNIIKATTPINYLIKGRTVVIRDISKSDVK